MGPAVMLGQDLTEAAGLVRPWRQMNKSPSRRFPVTVTQLPVTGWEICHRTVPE